jgi:DNA-binding PadR family transcriptional regulator
MSCVVTSVILITKQLRMDWVDVMATDRALPPASLKVACAIGTHFDNKSGMTYVSQETLHKVTDLSVATVQRALQDLERRGYIIIERREIGEREDGRKVYGGKGVANVYLPALDTVKISATDRGLKLAQRVRQAWDETQNAGKAKHLTDEVLSGAKHITGDVLNNCHSTSNTSAKHITGDVPTLTSSSKKNSSRARGPSCPDGLGPPGDLLRQRLGEGRYASWFTDVELVSIGDGSVTLSAPTAYRASRIRQDFETSVLDAWRLIAPDITRVIITSRKGAAA